MHKPLRSRSTVFSRCAVDRHAVNARRAQGLHYRSHCAHNLPLQKLSAYKSTTLKGDIVQVKNTSTLTQMLRPLKVVHNFLKEDAKLKARMMRDPEDRPVVTCATEVPLEFICPISLEMMTGPVTLLQTGLNYDRQSLQEWLKTGGRVCPLTGIELEHSVVLRPNLCLQSKTARWADEHRVPYSPVDFEEEQTLKAAESKATACQRLKAALRMIGRLLNSRLPHPYPDIL